MNVTDKAREWLDATAKVARHAASVPAKPGKSDGVSESLDESFEHMLGHCHETGGDPRPTCDCVVCRAYRTERAEARCVAADERFDTARQDNADLRAKLDTAMSEYTAQVGELRSLRQDLTAAKTALRTSQDATAVTERQLRDERLKRTSCESAHREKDRECRQWAAINNEAITMLEAARKAAKVLTDVLGAAVP